MDDQAPASADQAPATVRYAELPLDSIVPNARQPRQVFDDEALTELAFSIGEIGLLQPVVVRPVGDGRFELVAGERRLRACRLAGLTAVPAIVRQTDDDDLLRDALLENLHRADLNPLEEAAAYQQLLADFGCTQEELARRIGRSRPQVTNTLRLLRLPPDVQRRVAAGVLSAGHARALLSLDDPAAMETLATRIVAEGLSVRAVEEIVLVGEADGRPRPTRTRRPRSQTVEDVVSQHVSRAAEALDTRVAARGFGRADARGRLVIECADVADLARIVALLSD
jgi:ParB family chromosome partitioning protein